VIEMAAPSLALADPLEQPRRRPGERLLGRELDQRAAKVHVAVADVDVARAGAVGGARDRLRERRVLEQAVDDQRLARLEVDSDPHGQVGVALEAFVRVHPPEPYVSVGVSFQVSPYPHSQLSA